MRIDEMNSSRRGFLSFSAAALAGLALGGRGTRAEEAKAEKGLHFGPGPYAGLPMGVQSYTFRDRSFDKALDAIKNELKLDYVEIYPGHVLHMPPEKVKAMVADHGLTASGYGVVHFSKDDAANRKLFEFAKEIGVPHLTCDPTPDAFDSLDKLTEEFKITADIHDHGPGNHWAKVQTIYDALQGHSKMIGLCNDMGHFIRAGEDPLHACELFGSRMHAVHLKDFKKGLLGWEDCALGEGSLKLEDIIKYLISVEFRGDLSLEYEGHKPDETCLSDLDHIRKIVATDESEHGKK